VVCVFARKTSEPLASLVKQIDKKIGENNKLKSFVVVLTREGDKAAEDLRKLASSAGIKHVPLTIHGDGHASRDWLYVTDDAEVSGLARRLASGPVQAFAQTKALLTREQDMSLSAAIELEAMTQALLMKGEDYAEFHAAFNAGRPAQWTGR